MKVLRNVVAQLTFAFCCLLAFLLFFENGLISLPWLHVFGRMHPLLLHFPIVLLIVYAFLQLVQAESQQNTKQSLESGDLLLGGAFFSSLSALAGLLLSKEPGYNGDEVLWHKWAGAIVAFGAYCWYAYRHRLRKLAAKALSIAMVALVAIAGHLGAKLTHGENFVLAPLQQKSKQPVSLAEAEVFEHLVRPVLEEKCMACHNSRKAKGELIMESHESMAAGGKSGALWDSEEPGKSLLVSRIYLPENAEEHMPPKGKPQLTEDEIQILEAWVNSGAPFDALVASFPEDHQLAILARKRLSPDVLQDYDFGFADQAVVASLNSFYRLVTPVSQNSPALSARFLPGGTFDSEQVRQLEPVKNQLVELNLSKLPLADDDIRVIAGFSNLEKLNVSFCNISDEGLKSLAGLKKLKELSLAGTSVSAVGLEIFGGHPALRRIFIWNTPAAAAGNAVLPASLAGVVLEAGYTDEGRIIQLPGPIIENSSAIFSDLVEVRIKHNIAGSELHYTLDGSEPDSLHSAVLEENLGLRKSAVLKVKAFKSGWYASETVSKIFLGSTGAPAQVSLLTKPASKYKAEYEVSLFDKEKGSTNHGDGYWLGYEGTPMEVLLQFNGALPDSVGISYLLSTASYIMPPAAVEIWWGESANKLSLYRRHQFGQPGGHRPVASEFAFFDLPNQRVPYIKLVVEPVKKLPEWHSGKGKPAWVFVDELLLN